MSTSIFDDTPDDPPRLPDRRSKRSQKVVKPPRLGGTELDSMPLRLSLVFVQEVVIMPVESRHWSGLWAQRTPAVLGMQGARWLRGIVAANCGGV